MLSNTPLTHTQTHTVHPQTHGQTLNSLIQGQTAVTRRRCCSQDVAAAFSRSLIRICANFLVHKIFVAELQLPGLVMFGFVLRCCDKEEIVKPSAPSVCSRLIQQHSPARRRCWESKHWKMEVNPPHNEKKCIRIAKNTPDA